MRVLTVLTYYRPHVSGLTIYAERLAKALVENGHEVTILTMRHDLSCPTKAVEEGVTIHRAPVLFKLSKGMISPSFGRSVTSLLHSHDLIHLHLPQFDAAAAAVRARVAGKPVISTYHCDLRLPPSSINFLAGAAVNAVSRVALRLSTLVVSYTEDYANHSGMLRRSADKVRIIPPPVNPLPYEQAKFTELLEHHGSSGPLIGMAARLASEKGLEVLLEAMPSVISKFPGAKVLFAGEYKNVVGEKNYYLRLKKSIDRLLASGNFRFLGVLSQPELGQFMRAIDLLVLPSLNSTESFGLVQIEAMLSGTPVVASDLPGVRQPVKRTGMGLTVPVGNQNALADAICRVLSDPGLYGKSKIDIKALHDPKNVARQYEAVFQEAISTKAAVTEAEPC